MGSSSITVLWALRQGCCSHGCYSRGCSSCGCCSRGSCSLAAAPVTAASVPSAPVVATPSEAAMWLLLPCRLPFLLLLSSVLDPRHWVQIRIRTRILGIIHLTTEPALGPDPALFVSYFQDANKKLVFWTFFSLLPSVTVMMYSLQYFMPL